jgi:hypothetical protein
MGGQLVDDRVRYRIGKRRHPGRAVPQHLDFCVAEVGEVSEGMELRSDEGPAMCSLHRQSFRIPGSPDHV